MKGFRDQNKSKKKKNKYTNTSKEDIINQAYKFHSQDKISNVPWEDVGVNVVIDSSGIFQNVIDSHKIVDKNSIKVIITHSPKTYVDKTQEEYASYTLVNFLLTLFFHLIFRVNKRKNKTLLFKEFMMDYNHPLIQDASMVLSDSEKRTELISYGQKCVESSHVED